MAGCLAVLCKHLGAVSHFPRVNVSGFMAKHANKCSSEVAIPSFIGSELLGPDTFAPTFRQSAMNPGSYPSVRLVPATPGLPLPPLSLFQRPPPLLCLVKDCKILNQALLQFPAVGAASEGFVEPKDRIALSPSPIWS